MKTPCPICEAHTSNLWAVAFDAEYHTMPGRKFRYLECLQCKVVFIEDDLENSLTEIYPNNYYSFNEDGYNLLHKVKFLLDAKRFREIGKFLPKQISTLDIGGGFGQLSNQVKNALKHKLVYTTVVDLDYEAGALAEKKGHKYIHARFENAAFEEKYDLVLAFNIVEHVRNPKMFISKVYESLSDGGLAIFQTPNYDSMDAKLFKARYWGGLHAPRHFVLFSEDSFQEALKSAGFEIIRWERIPGGPFWAYSILGSINTNNLKIPLYMNKAYFLLTAVFSAFDLARKRFWKTSQILFVVKKNVN